MLGKSNETRCVNVESHHGVKCKQTHKRQANQWVKTGSDLVLMDPIYLFDRSQKEVDLFRTPD